MNYALVVVAQEGYQDKEYEGTVKGLTAAGYDIIISSKEVGPCTGKFGGTVQATMAMRDADTSDFEKVAFIGGPGARPLAGDEDAVELVMRFTLRKKPIGAICIAPTILAAAGVLQGKKATVHDTDGKDAAFLRDHGAVYTGEPVTVDGLFVTANGPDAAEEFGKTLASLKA